MIVNGGDGAQIPTKVAICARCNGKRQLGSRRFPITCPACAGKGAIPATEEMIRG